MSTIGYVLAEFPVLSETFIGNEIRSMMAHGHTIVPMTLRMGTPDCQPEDKQLRDEVLHLSPAVANRDALSALPALDWMTASRLNFAVQQTSLPLRSLLWQSLKIASIAKRAGCTHLHAHFSGPATAHAIVAARMLDIPVSFVCHGHDVYQEPLDLELKLRNADFVVAVSQDMANDLAMMAPKTRISTLACAVEPARFVPRQGRVSNGRLLFVGRLVEQKGLDDVISALATMAPGERPPLDVVGEGPLRLELESQVARLGLTGDDVRFLGSKLNSWIAAEGPNYMAFISAFKPAADGSRDGAPVVVKEAMAMGLPVVATRFVGLKENVTPETGYLVEVGDVPALAAAVASLVRLGEDGRIAMGQRGRERVVELYSLAAHAKQLTALIEDVSRANRGGQGAQEGRKVG